MDVVKFATNLAMTRAPIIFIRGFNSYSREDLRFGPLNLGPVHRHLQPEFEKHGYRFIALERMGFGPLDEQIERAQKQILTLRLGASFHLLGHSTGGVIARGLAHALQNSQRVLSVTTIVSPHRGSTLADQAECFQAAHPFWYRFWKSAGYDVAARVPLLEPMKVKAMAEFNEKYPNLPNVQYASIVSGAPLKTLPLLMRMIGQFAANSNEVTDGVVEKASQPWGEIIGDFVADHGAIIGFRTMLSPRSYEKTQLEFRDAVEQINRFYSRVEDLQ